MGDGISVWWSDLFIDTVEAGAGIVCSSTTTALTSCFSGSETVAARESATHQ